MYKMQPTVALVDSFSKHLKFSHLQLVFSCVAKVLGYFLWLCSASLLLKSPRRTDRIIT